MKFQKRDFPTFIMCLFKMAAFAYLRIVWRRMVRTERKFISGVSDPENSDSDKKETYSNYKFSFIAILINNLYY